MGSAEEAYQLLKAARLFPERIPAIRGKPAATAKSVGRVPRGAKVPRWMADRLDVARAVVQARAAVDDAFWAELQRCRDGSFQHNVHDPFWGSIRGANWGGRILAEVARGQRPSGPRVPKCRNPTSAAKLQCPPVGGSRTEFPEPGWTLVGKKGKVAPLARASSDTSLRPVVVMRETLTMPIVRARSLDGQERRVPPAQPTRQPQAAAAPARGARANAAPARSGGRTAVRAAGRPVGQPAAAAAAPVQAAVSAPASQDAGAPRPPPRPSRDRRRGRNPPEPPATSTWATVVKAQKAKLVPAKTVHSTASGPTRAVVDSSVGPSNELPVELEFADWALQADYEDACERGEGQAFLEGHRKAAVKGPNGAGGKEPVVVSFQSVLPSAPSKARPNARTRRARKAKAVAALETGQTREVQVQAGNDGQSAATTAVQPLVVVNPASRKGGVGKATEQVEQIDHPGVVPPPENQLRAVWIRSTKRDPMLEKLSVQQQQVCYELYCFLCKKTAFRSPDVQQGALLMQMAERWLKDHGIESDEVQCSLSIPAVVATFGMSEVARQSLLALQNEQRRNAVQSQIDFVTRGVVPIPARRWYTRLWHRFTGKEWTRLPVGK